MLNLAAGRFARALELYDLDVPLADADSGPGGVRNRVVIRLARAAAALGANQPRRALDDLNVVDGALGDPRVTATFKWPHAAPADVLDTYRLIASGLRANADRAAGDSGRRLQRAGAAARGVRGAPQTLGPRRDLRALILAELRLTRAAVDRRAAGEAGRWATQAVEDGAKLTKRTHAPVDAAELDALWMAAELGAASVPLSFDLVKSLREVSGRPIKEHDRVWRGYQAWFEAYLALATTPASTGPPAPSAQ